MNSSTSSCIVCCSQLKSQQNGRNLTTEDLQVFLEAMLEYPDFDLKSPSLLKYWILLCNRCLAVIREGRQLKEQILQLEKQFNHRQKLIVEKIKSTFKNRSRKKVSEEIKSERSHTINKIRSFVHLRSYKNFNLIVRPEVGKIPVQNIKTEEEESSEEQKPSIKTESCQKFVILTEEKGSFHNPEVFMKEEEEGEDGEDDVEMEESVTIASCNVTHSQSQFYYCGLCEDEDTGEFLSFSNAADLQRHQKTAHPLPRPQAQVKSKSKRALATPATDLVIKEEDDLTNDREDNSSSPEPEVKTDADADYIPDEEETAEEKAEGFPSRKKVRVRLNRRFRYSCPNCPQVKDYTVNRYAQHLGIHQRNPFRCSECSELFPNDELLPEQHWKDKHQDKPQPSEGLFIKIKFNPGEIWKCEGCLKGFFTEKDRNLHESGCHKWKKFPNIRKRMEAKEKPFKCLHCPKNFRIIEEWRLHRTIHHLEVDSMSCMYCDESFQENVVGLQDSTARNEMKFWLHLKAKHKLDHENEDCKVHDECETCGVVFIGSSSAKPNHVFKEHGIPKKKAYVCKVCRLPMSYASSVRKHMTLVHFSEAKVCQQCGEEFRDEKWFNHHNFLKHGIIPDGGKIFLCPQEGCDYKSVVELATKQHYNQIHKNDLTRPFKCEICGKGFTDKNHCMRHVAIHENKNSKPYQCEMCGSSFALQNYLYIHKRLSHEKRKFPSGFKKKPPRKKKK